MKSIKTKLAAAGLAAGLAAAALGQSAAFRFHGPLSRVITPNGDGVNDTAFICVDNPQDSEVSGKLYTLLGAEVASFSPRQPVVAGAPSCPAGSLPASAQYLSWDGRASGELARSGIYVYRVTAENRAYTGTLLVVR